MSTGCNGFTRESDKGIRYYDLDGGHQLGIPNSDACCDLCMATPGCAAWQFVGTDAQLGNSGECYLKSGYATSAFYDEVGSSCGYLPPLPSKDAE